MVVAVGVLLELVDLLLTATPISIAVCVSAGAHRSCPNRIPCARPGFFTPLNAKLPTALAAVVAALFPMVVYLLF
jgi:hypothetical protein